MAQLTISPQRQLLVAMKVESAYATDVFAGTYTSADIIPAYDINPDLNIEEIPNTMASGDIGRLPSVIGAEMAQVSWSMWLRGSGVAYSASIKPEADRPLRGCTLIGTLDATVSAEKWTYQPGTPESYTIYIVGKNARTLKMTGCFGTVTFRMRAGGQCIATFTFRGKVGGVSDVTYVAGTVAGTPQYPVMKSSAFQLGTGNYAPRIANLGVDLGNTVTPVPAVNDGQGVAGFFVSDRNPRISLDPEADTVANFDWYTAFKDGTLQDLSWLLGGAVQYNRATFRCSAAATPAAQAQVVGNSWGARDGLVSSPTTLLATISAGSDDFALMFH